MTLCPYCHDWLSLCRCPVVFFPTEKSIGTNPGKTQFAGEKDCSTTPVTLTATACFPVRRLDDKGRCCGRKPIDYKGGAWNSPLRPEKFCGRCSRSYDRVTGEQIENWAHKACPGCGTWIAGSSSACGECTSEQEDCA